MERKCYSDYLLTETNTVRILVIRLQEQRDELLHVKAPFLEHKYSEMFGSQEDQVQKAEMECELTQKKIDLIRRAINRREPVDLDAIDQEIATMRQEMMSEMTQTPDMEFGINISDEKLSELQEIYRKIVEDFHPSTHPELTDIQKALYTKAMDAYRRHDLEGITMIQDVLESAMLCDSAMLTASLTMTLSDKEEESVDEAVCAINRLEELSTDYSLAKVLYPCFNKPEAELIAEDALKQLQEEAQNIEQQIGQIKQNHPFAAQALMDDPVKAEEYRAQLESRLYAAENKLAELTSRVSILYEGG